MCFNISGSWKLLPYYTRMHLTMGTRAMYEHGALQTFCMAGMVPCEKLIHWFASQTAGALILLYLDIIRFNQQFSNK